MIYTRRYIMKNNKPWYERINIWITIIAGICTILGISIFGNISFVEDVNDRDSFINSENNEQEFNSVQLKHTQPEGKGETLQDEPNNFNNPSQQFVNEKIKEITSQLASIQNDNDQLKNEVSQYQNEISNLQNELEKIKTEYSEIVTENNQLQNEIEQYQNEIKELQSKPNEYIEKYETIQEDNFEMVSIFTFETFKGKDGWHDSKYSQSSFTDTYGNTYPSAYEASHIWEESHTYNSPPVYLLDGKYSKCQGQFAWPKEKKDKKGRIWIEFYGDDELLYKTEKISADDRAFTFEFDVSNVQKLKICRRASIPSIYAIYPYLNLIH